MTISEIIEFSVSATNQALQDRYCPCCSRPPDFRYILTFSDGLHYVYCSEKCANQDIGLASVEFKYMPDAYMARIFNTFWTGG